MKNTSPVAKKIIKRCGGPKKVAAWLNITAKSVYCWTYPKPQGTGGSIPTKWQNLLLEAAEKHKISLSPADFFESHKPLKSNRQQ